MSDLFTQLMEEKDSLQRALNKEREWSAFLQKERNSLITRNSRLKELLKEGQEWFCSEVCTTNHKPFCMKIMDFLNADGKSWETSRARAAESGILPGRNGYKGV